MKVCFYFGVFARNGGIEEFTRDLGGVLLESGAEIEVVCASLKHRLLDELQSLGARITRIPIYWGCRWRIPDFALLPLGVIRAGTADIVVHRKPHPSLSYRLLSRRPKHIYITAYRPSEQFPDAVKRKLFFSWFDVVFTQTEEFRKDLVECGLKKPIIIIPHIPPATEEPIGSIGKGDVLRIGILGRLEGQKNHREAFRILNRLSAELPPRFNHLEFNIYGDGALMGELTAKALSCSYKVNMHGRYKRTEIHLLAQQNDLFLIPSFSEGQCIVALEILAAGRPLFASPVGALPEILEGNPVRGNLIPLDDAEGSSKIIRNWLGQNKNVNPVDIQESYRLNFDANTIRRQYSGLILDSANSARMVHEGG